MSENILACSECGKEYRTQKPLDNHLFKVHNIGEPSPFSSPVHAEDKADKMAAARARVHNEVKAKYIIFLSTISMALNAYPATKADAMVINDNMALVSDSVATAAETNVQIVEVVDKLVTSLSMFFVFATHAAIIQGIVANHTKPATKAARDDVVKLREQLRNDAPQNAETETETVG